METTQPPKLTALGEYMQLGDPRHWVVLDTETCGLDSDAHVCQLGCIDLASGDVIIDELVNPLRPIPARATAVHGITDQMVRRSWSAFVIINRLRTHLAQTKQGVITWNAAFDLDALCLSLDSHAGCSWCSGLKAVVRLWDWKCAMTADMELLGLDRWRRLPGMERKLPHHAIDDCRAVRALLVDEERISVSVSPMIHNEACES